MRGFTTENFKLIVQDPSKAIVEDIPGSRYQVVRVLEQRFGDSFNLLLLLEKDGIQSLGWASFVSNFKSFMEVNKFQMPRECQGLEIVEINNAEIDTSEKDRALKVFEQFVQNFQSDKPRNHEMLENFLVELKNEIFESMNESNSEILDTIVGYFESINDQVFENESRGGKLWKL